MQIYWTYINSFKKWPVTWYRFAGFALLIYNKEFYNMMNIMDNNQIHLKIIHE